MIHAIKILDTGLDRYRLEPQEITLGRQYDNEADEIVIERPNAEQNSLCTMIVTDINGTIIDHIIMENDTYKITSNISKYKSVKIGFSFSRKDGYIKNSEIIIGKFLLAQKPEGFVPVEPEQKKNINFLISYGFTDSKLVGNELQFFNMNGDKVVSFDLSPFTQEQSDLGETDVSRETFVRGKKTSNLVNDGENGTSPYATQAWTTQKFVSVEEENTFEAKQNFNGETEFNAPINSNAGVNITNDVLKVLDNTGGKDIVTQYSADEIVMEDSGTQYNLTLPKKSGTIALTTDVPEVSIDNSTITKNADGKLQAVGLKTDTTTLTAEQVWLACSIEREV